MEATVRSLDDHRRKKVVPRAVWAGVQPDHRRRNEVTISIQCEERYDSQLLEGLRRLAAPSGRLQIQSRRHVIVVIPSSNVGERHRFVLEAERLFNEFTHRQNSTGQLLPFRPRN